MLGRVVPIVLVLTSVASAQPAPPPATGPAPPPPTDASLPPPASPGPPSATSPAPPPEMAPVPPLASPPRRNGFGASLHVVIGGGPRYWLYGAWAVDGGVAILQGPVRVRARVLATLVGGVVQSDWSGPFRRYGAGLELRGCTEGDPLCGFVDVDVGFQQLTLRNSIHEDDDHRGLFLGPRVGFDIGYRFRFRVAVEVYRHLTDGSFTSRGLSLGLAYQR